MNNKKMLTILTLGVLLMSSSGVAVVSAASGQSVFGSGDMGASYFTDPSFLSPDWKAAPVTSTFADPSFLSKDWAVPNLNKPYANGSLLSSYTTSPSLPLLYTDPSFFSPNYTASTITPLADSTFLLPNWSVPDFSKADPFLQVYNYNPGSSNPFTVPDQSQKNTLPSFNPFASNPGPGWTSGGYLF